MSRDPHQRARELAMDARIETASEPDQRWLQAHLAECPACAEAVAALDAAIGNLRAPAIMADVRLVRTTQMRVRARAADLEERKASMRPLWFATALVMVYALVSTAAAWETSAVAGGWFRMTAISARLVFALVWIAPAIGASLLLLACGSHRARWSALAGNSES